MKEVFEKLIDYILQVYKQKITNPVYSTFISFWVLCNLQFIYNLFFTSEKSIIEVKHLLKSEYIFGYSNYCENWSCLWTSFHSLIIIQFLLRGIVLPGILTWLVLWYLPKHVFIPVIKKQEEDRVEKVNAKNNADMEIQKQKDRNEISAQQSQIDKAKIQREGNEKQIELIKSIKDVEKEEPKTIWEKEYQEMKKNTVLYEKFDSLYRCIYEYQGKMKAYGSYGNDDMFDLDTFIFAFSESNSIIKESIIDDSKGVELLDKGRFFMKLYIKDKAKDLELIPF